MFENLLSKLITKIFGKYIVLDSIHVPLWKGMHYCLRSGLHYTYTFAGDVSLENLTVNKEAFSFPNSPFEVIQGMPCLHSTATWPQNLGTISKFSLNVPWMHLATEPVVLKIDGLYILAARKDFYDVRVSVRVHDTQCRVRGAVLATKSICRRDPSWKKLWQRVDLQI